MKLRSKIYRFLVIGVSLGNLNSTNPRNEDIKHQQDIKNAMRHYPFIKPVKQEIHETDISNEFEVMERPFKCLMDMDIFVEDLLKDFMCDRPYTLALKDLKNIFKYHQNYQDPNLDKINDLFAFLDMFKSNDQYFCIATIEISQIAR